MSLNERLISVGAAACTTDSADVFGDASGVALYTLDYDGSEASGLYDGTPDSAVQFGVAGVTNYAARFSSNTTGIVNTSLKLNSTAHSISLWVKPAEVVSGRWNTIFMSAFLGYPYGFLGKRPDQSTSFHYRTESGNELYFTLSSADTWYHIVITRDSGGVDIYVDGSFVTSNSDSMGTYSSSSYEKTAIGSNPLYPAEYFKGDVDQVRIFNKVLSTDEIATLYNSGAGETACVYTCTTDTVDYPTTNVAYYKLDNSAEDETGNYDGTPTDINYAFGRFGQAAVFNGSSSYIDTGFSVYNKSVICLSAWINVDDLSSTQMFFGSTCSSGCSFGGQVNTNGTIRFRITDGTEHNATTSNTISAGQWYNIVCVWDKTIDSGELKIYIDGTEASYSTQQSQTNNTTENVSLRLGRAASTYFNGSIDQVRIFSSALTSTQVTELYEEYECEDTSTFQTVLYTGNDSTQYISNVGFEPDLVWVKNRTGSFNHVLVDSIRGANNLLFSDTTAAALTSNTTLLSSIDELGFTVGYDGTDVTNGASNNYVAWVWKAGGDAVPNTDGSITSQVSANTDAGFSIVSYTGAASGTVGHGLGVPPELIITKRTASTGVWATYSNTLGTDKLLELDSDSDAQSISNYWGTSAPTSTVYGLSTNSAHYNANGAQIAYCWHSVAGYSKMGSYSGNSNTQTIITGFKPSFVMIKTINTVSNWIIFDDKRPGEYLMPSLPNQGYPSTDMVTSFVSNGFTLGADVSTAAVNWSGANYIYMAFK